MRSITDLLPGAIVSGVYFLSELKQTGLSLPGRSSLTALFIWKSLALAECGGLLLTLKSHQMSELMISREDAP